MPSTGMILTMSSTRAPFGADFLFGDLRNLKEDGVRTGLEMCGACFFGSSAGFEKKVVPSGFEERPPANAAREQQVATCYVYLTQIQSNSAMTSTSLPRSLGEEFAVQFSFRESIGHMY